MNLKIIIILKLFVKIKNLEADLKFVACLMLEFYFIDQIRIFLDIIFIFTFLYFLMNFIIFY